MERKTITITISQDAWKKLNAVKKEKGTPYNFQIEQAILAGA